MDYTLPYLQTGNSPEFFLSKQSFSPSALATYENDAGGTWRKKNTISIFRTAIYDELTYSGIAASLQRNRTRFILAHAMFGKENIPKTAINDELNDSPFFKTGQQYGYQNSHSKFVIQNDLSESIRLAYSINLYHTKIDSISDTKGNLSVGFMSQSKNFDFGISLQNLFPVSMRLPSNEKIPTLVIISTRLKPRSWVQLSPRAIFIRSSVNKSRNVLFSSGLHIYPLHFLSIDIATYEQFSGEAPKASLAFGTSLTLSNSISISYVYRDTEFQEKKESHLIGFSFQF